MPSRTMPTPDRASAVRLLVPILREIQCRDARKRLIPYVEATYPAYRAAPHHRQIAGRLEAVARGECKRLLIIMPPRHGKSELASRRFPLWYLGQNPHHEVIAASYGGELASLFGRTLRNVAQGSEHARIFPQALLAPDSQAQNRWHTRAGGSYLAVGVGGAITGHGANVLIIDDAVKGREEAESARMQEVTWDWFVNDAYTRLMPGACVVVIGTRWHELDLIGRLKMAEETGGDAWETLHMPAINAQGGALWPEQFDLEALESIRRNIGTRAWSSLYMGDPTPESGTYFMREWFQYADPPPRQHMRIYAASDYATKHGEGDYTTHVIVGVTPEDDIHILDVWRRQAESDTWIEVAVGMMERWEPIVWAEESGQIEKSVGPFLRKQMLERKVYCRRQQFPSAADKATRARSIQGRWAMRKVYFPRTRPDWLPELEAELLKFPLGANDDQVDALSLIGRMVAGLQPGKVPTISERMGVLHYPPDGTIEQVDLNSDDARLMLDLGWKPGKPPHAVPGVSEVSIDRLWEDRDKERPGWR